MYMPMYMYIADYMQMHRHAQYRYANCIQYTWALPRMRDSDTHVLGALGSRTGLGFRV